MLIDLLHTSAMEFTSDLQATGGNTTGFVVPETVLAGLDAGRRPKVAATVNGHTWRTSIASMGGQFLLGVSEAVREAAGIAAEPTATDSAMIIDAMDLLYSARFDGFCIVSSDSDFTRIAMRIRESGLTVYGFGERKTPHPFVAACDKFIYTEILIDKDDEIDVPARQTQAVKAIGKDLKLAGLLRKAVEAASDDTGWANLSPVGSQIAKQAPDFDPRNYGFRKLRELVAASKLFDMEERVVGAGPGKQVYLRESRKRSP